MNHCVKYTAHLYEPLSVCCINFKRLKRIKRFKRTKEFFVVTL